MVTGASMAYVAGGGEGHRPIPLATNGVRRGTHAPPAKPKPTGLDWDALTPTCKSCGTKSGQVGGNEGLCPTCRGVAPVKTKTKEQDRKIHAGELPEDELLRRFTGPDDTTLGRDLAELEATDPDVAAAAESFEETVEQVLRPDDHVVPEHLDVDPAELGDIRPKTIPADVTSDEVEERATPAHSGQDSLDAQAQHAARVLHDTAGATDPVARLLRLNVLSAVDALYHYTQLHPETPAPATSTPPARDTTSTTRARIPGDGGRPAADAEGEAARQPATRPRRVMDTDEARKQRRRGPTGPRVDVDRIVELYTAGNTIKQVYETTGYATATIRRHLKDRGLLRTRGPAPGTGGKHYDQALVDDVRRLYLDEQLTQLQVGQRLEIGLKVVQNVMAYADIPARDAAHARSMAGIGHPIKIQPDQHQLIIDRYQAGEPGASIGRDYDCTAHAIYAVLKQHGIERHLNRVAPGVDTLNRLRTAIEATGATSRQIKDWAIAQGLITTISRGLPHLELVEAYAAAHPTATPDQVGDTTA